MKSHQNKNETPSPYYSIPAGEADVQREAGVPPAKEGANKAAAKNPSPHRKLRNADPTVFRIIQ